MAMNMNNYKRKFKLLFEMLFQKDFEFCSYYSENLLKFLRDCPDKTAEKIFETPYFSDLIMYSLKNIENATISVKVFVIEVLTIVFRNELQFSKFQQMEGILLIKEKLLKKNCNKINPAVGKAGLMLVMTSLDHCSGLNWVVESKLWTQSLPLEERHIGPSRSSKYVFQLISKLVWKLNKEDDETTLMEVLNHFIDPIKKSGCNNVHEINDETEKNILRQTFDNINLLLVIVSESDNIRCENKIVPLLIRHFLIEPSLGRIMKISRNKDLVCMAGDLIFRLKFFNDVVAWKKNKHETDIHNEIISSYYNLFHCFLKKRMVAGALHFVVKCNMFWSQIGNSLVSPTFERHGRTFEIGNQFLLLVIVPLVAYSYTEKQKEVIEFFFIKVSAFVTEHILRLGYSFRHFLDGSDIKTIAILSMRELYKFIGSANDLQSGIIYQALYYMLQTYILTDNRGALILEKIPLKSPDDVKLLSLVMGAIKLLLKDHNINWYESVEIMSLQNCLLNLLKQIILPTKQLLQTLELIDLSINKFLCPDLALLIESKRGSTLNEIGTVMTSYIHHEDWEVRDSALQLLLSCTDVAFVKYIQLQKLISENNLMPMASQLALNDPEFYVQSTALRCLAAATKIESIWRDVVSVNPNIYLQLCDVMKNNSEGIVRKEAANVLTEVYINLKVTNAFANHMYTVMATAALKDLHWEVQLVALTFWKHAILTKLFNRGMIDGKFPSVTFSREKRKIITLNEIEIEKQLIAIMNELSAIGCLSVLHKCMSEEYSLEVIEQAYKISFELVNILDFYKFGGVPEDMEDNPSSYREVMDDDEEFTSYKDKSNDLKLAMDLSFITLNHSLDMQNKIIEDIVNTNQIDQILELYVNSQDRSQETDEKHSILASLNNEVMQPNIFIKSFKENDYSSMLEGKKNWNSGPSDLDTLLDEILSLGELKPNIMELECV